jgi:polar amino acid transport system substrate-binding protein
MIWRSVVNGLAVAATALLLSGVPAQADEIADIKARGVFKVGMAESPPWQSPNPASGEYEGFNVDMAKRVAEIMEVKLEIVPATWSTLIPGLEAKQYDVVFANLFATPKRALVVNFTEPYSNYGFHVVVTATSPIQSIEDLNKDTVTFVGMSGTVEESYPKEVFPNAKVRGIANNDVAAWIGEVASGQADAAFLDPGTLRLISSKNPDLKNKIRILNDEANLLKPVGLAYAVRPEDAHLLQFLNTFIRDFVRNGENVTLRDQWFEELAKRQ